MSSESKAKGWKNSLKRQKWGEHKHCMVCGKAVPMERDFCAQTCKDKYQSLEKDKSKKGTWQIVMIFVVMIVMMVLLPMLT